MKLPRAISPGAWAWGPFAAAALFAAADCPPAGACKCMWGMKVVLLGWVMFDSPEPQEAMAGDTGGGSDTQDPVSEEVRWSGDWDAGYGEDGALLLCGTGSCLRFDYLGAVPPRVGSARGSAGGETR